MSSREFSQCPFCPFRQIQEHAATIRRVLLLDGQPVPAEAARQLNGAVMADRQLLCQFPHGDTFAASVAFDGKQRLMLPGRHPGGLGGLLAESEEAPDPVSEFGQRGVIQLRNFG